MTLASLLFIAIGTGITWWLSGYDSRVTGENPKEDFIRRATRTGISCVLLALATLNGFAAIFIFVGLGLYWASCGAGFFSGQIHKLIDPEDTRPFDPKETDRKLDFLAQLIRQGRTNEALDLCSALEQSGEASSLALEAMVHRLYQETLNSTETLPLFADVRSYYDGKEFDRAESQLNGILAAEPKNWAAMLYLMQVYAEGLYQPQKALALLQPADNQPHMHPAFVKYARQSIAEWSTPKRQPMDASRVPADSQPVAEVSIDELLKNNQLSTAVEYLEKAIADEPRNFECWLKLAEVHAVNCADPNRAVKIIHKMESSSTFTPQEMEVAKARLKEWRAGRRS